jgi:hypothetical protein
MKDSTRETDSMAVDAHDRVVPMSGYAGGSAAGACGRSGQVGTDTL